MPNRTVCKNTQKCCRIINLSQVKLIKRIQTWYTAVNSVNFPPFPFQSTPARRIPGISDGCYQIMHDACASTNAYNASWAVQCAFSRIITPTGLRVALNINKMEPDLSIIESWAGAALINPIVYFKAYRLQINCTALSQRSALQVIEIEVAVCIAEYNLVLMSYLCVGQV